MWSPCANPFLKNVMKRVVEKMKIEEECHNNSQVLHQELEFSLGSKIVGVEFEDSLSGKTDVNKNMKISFRLVLFNHPTYRFSISDVDDF